MFWNSKENVSEKQVLKVLGEVLDPDLKKDIVSLGFVKNLAVKGGDIQFDVELTTPACPVKEELKAECEKKVGALEGVKSVSVNMTANVRKSTPQGTAPGRISLPGVKNVVAVASGKGGVGKSTVTINLAVALAQAGAKVGILDADIYGPSVPLMMGATEKPMNQDGRIHPVEKNGIKIMSMGFLAKDGQPVIWRGPMVHGVLQQFLSQVEWGDLDYLLIDMPPGTGDAQLTISQTAPLSGAIIVTTPQEVSLIDARKGLMMFRNVSVPILGVIENMASFSCPHCKEISHIFRHGGGNRIAEEMKAPLLGSIPIDPLVADSGDLGAPIVATHPDSAVGMRYKRLAGDVAAQLSVLQAQSGGFQPTSLEWH
ncbi:MAG: Mrp/NBP35 family ATP-binding protein [Deltaproteobacteria bacterium]|nr:Mrp/NBP35 family ATP-binding protein [Deltaproteobacteria bacterium]